MQSSSHIDHLKSLAPDTISIRRKNRFDGNGLTISLANFSEIDASRVTTIYQKVNWIYQTWLSNDKNCLTPELISQISKLNDDSFFQTVHSLGGAMNEFNHRTALHDIKGGSLNSLLGLTQLISEGSANERLVQRSVNMARDHAKIMRNIIRDIDPNLREEDESNQAHHILHFVEKLQDFNFEFKKLKLKIDLYCLYDGLISNRCLETSSIDRILYNFINNAAKYSADHQACIHIFPINSIVVRFVFDNAVSQDHLNWFSHSVQEDTSKLFLSNNTYKGGGIGLCTCTEIIRDCFGLGSAQETVEKGYIGATLEGARFYSWFHWPVLAEAE